MNKIKTFLPSWLPANNKPSSTPPAATIPMPPMLYLIENQASANQTPIIAWRSFVAAARMRGLFGSLAQPVEQRTFNPLVERSNRSRPTKFKPPKQWIRRFFFTRWFFGFRICARCDSQRSRIMILNNLKFIVNCLWIETALFFLFGLLLFPDLYLIRCWFKR